MMPPKVWSIDEFSKFVNFIKQIDYEHLADMFNKCTDIRQQVNDDVTAEELMEWDPQNVYDIYQVVLKKAEQKNKKS